MPHLTNLMKRVDGNLGKLVPYIEGESVQVEVIEAEGGVEVEHISKSARRYDAPGELR